MYHSSKVNNLGTQRKSGIVNSTQTDLEDFLKMQAFEMTIEDK